MQFTNAAAVLAVAATANAWANDTVVYTTVVVDSYVTVCPASSTITYQGVTYTNTLTESSTITITNCPCTVTAPVSTTSSVAVPTTAPAAPSAPAVSVPVVSVPAVSVPAVSAPVWSNGTTVAPAPTSVPGGAVGTVTPVTSAPASATTSPASIPASGANKAFAMSGASLAGLLGLAAYLL